MTTIFLSESKKKKKKKKKSNGRSLMLKTIMPKLSGSTGEALIKAIESDDGDSVYKAMMKIGGEIRSEMRDSKSSVSRPNTTAPKPMANLGLLLGSPSYVQAYRYFLAIKDYEEYASVHVSLENVINGLLEEFSNLALSNHTHEQFSRLADREAVSNAGEALYRLRMYHEDLKKITKAHKDTLENILRSGKAIKKDLRDMS